MNYYEKQRCNNSYIDKIVLYNRDTEKYFQPKCKSYSCPKHGFIQRERLQKAIHRWLLQYKIIRFWTFTVRTDESLSIEVTNQLFKKAWHRFITDLRRSKLLTKKQRNLQYVKVYEHTKKGVLHVHLFSTEYVHYTQINEIWNNALACFFRPRNKQGNVHMKAHKSPRVAAKYIAKYVSKEAMSKSSRVRVWSKSGRISIFDKRVSSGRWVIIRKSSLNYLLLVNDVPILVQTTPSITKVRVKRSANVDHPRLFREHFDYFNQRYVFSYVS